MEKQKHDDRGISHFLVIFSIFVCCLLVVMVAWVRISDIKAAKKRHTQAVIEKKKFQDYSVLIKRLGQQIVAATSPAESKQIEYCDRTNVTYGEGELSCTSAYYLYYNDSSTEFADNIISEVEKRLIEQTGYRAEGFNTKYHSDLRVKTGIFRPKVRFSCSYSIANSKNELLIYQGNSYYPFNNRLPGTAAYLSCTDTAVEPYFKVIDY